MDCDYKQLILSLIVIFVFVFFYLLLTQHEGFESFVSTKLPMYYDNIPPSHTLYLLSDSSTVSDKKLVDSEHIYLSYSQSLLSPDKNYAFNFSTTNNKSNNKYFFNICKTNKLNNDIISVPPIILPPMYSIEIPNQSMTVKATKLYIDSTKNRLELYDENNNTIITYTLAINQIAKIYVTNNGCVYFGNIGIITPLIQKKQLKYSIGSKELNSDLTTKNSKYENNSIVSDVIYSPNGLYAFGFQSSKYDDNKFRYSLNLYSVSNGIVNYKIPLSTIITPQINYENYEHAFSLSFCDTNLKSLCLFDIRHREIIKYYSPKDEYIKLIVLNNGTVAILNEKNVIVHKLMSFSDILDNGITTTSVNNGSCTLGFINTEYNKNKLALFNNYNKHIYWTHPLILDDTNIHRSYFGIFNGKFMLYNPMENKYETISDKFNTNTTSLIVITKYDTEKNIIGGVIQLLVIETL